MCCYAVILISLKVVQVLSQHAQVYNFVLLSVPAGRFKYDDNSCDYSSSAFKSLVEIIIVKEP